MRCLSESTRLLRIFVVDLRIEVVADPAKVIVETKGVGLRRNRVLVAEHQLRGRRRVQTDIRTGRFDDDTTQREACIDRCLGQRVGCLLYTF